MSEPSPPDLMIVSTLCNTVSLTINGVAYSPYREPGHDLKALDAQYGSGAVMDPATTAHKLVRFYMLGAGDSLYSIGKLLGLEAHMLVSPAILARATAEYASRAVFLADAKESPQMRMSKMAAIYAEGFLSYTNGPSADAGAAKLGGGIADWRSSHPELPKTRVPKSNQSLVNKLVPDLGPAVYPLLHRLVHGNSVAISLVVMSAQLETYSKTMESWKHGLFASMCGIMALSHVTALWGVDPDPVNKCIGMYYAAELLHDQYLWDLSTARGFDPGATRPEQFWSSCDNL